MNDDSYAAQVSPTYWHVLFLERDFKHWYDVFTPRWCRHVLMYGYNARTGHWVWIDPSAEKTTVSILNDADWELACETLAERVSCRVLVKSGNGGFWRSRLITTCSSALHRIIGVPGGALSPLMLYRTLLRNDGQLKDVKNVSQSKSP